MRRSSLAVASAMVRLPRSIARRKMLSEWPCEVDASLSSGPDGSVTLERTVMDGEGLAARLPPQNGETAPEGALGGWELFNDRVRVQQLRPCL
jgi:hypothetical protein